MSKFSKEQRERVLRKTNGLCACCGKRLSSFNASIDHYIPLSKNGNSQLINLYAMCKECNMLKDDTIEKEFEHRVYYRYLPERYDNDLRFAYKQWEKAEHKHGKKGK